jgi:Soluble lytic murein transglycosylase and related regulatory proteins (some contain LysM/invasin domains)
MRRPRHSHLASVAALVALLGVGAAVMPAAATDRVVVVRPGDTLSQIALEQGVSVAQLVALNGLTNPSRIYPGQRLTVRASAPAAKPAPKPVIHRVKSGENLTTIAKHYGISIAAIVKASAISNPSYLRVGQQLTIPVTTAAGGSSRQSGTGMPAAMAAVVAQRDKVRQLLVKEASAQNVPVALVLAVAWQESGWQQQVVSSTGAVGVMQLMPATGEWIGTAMLGSRVDPRNAASNIHAGVRLLKHYLDRYSGDRALILAAYFQGERGTDLRGVYPVTRPYIASIEALEAIFSR